jgi:hypothetical protein
MESISLVQPPLKKVYKSSMIRVATFIGGPLAAGYLMSENFKVFNEPENARKAIIYSIIATVAIIGVALLIPGLNRGQSYLFPLIYAWIAWYLVQHYQGANISSHDNAGGETYSWWRPIGISLICLVIMLVAVIIFVMVSGV